MLYSCSAPSLGGGTLSGKSTVPGLNSTLIILQQARSDSPERCADRPTRRSRNTKAPHLVKQRGALHAEPGGCSFRTAEPPVRALAGCDNFSTYLFFKCR